MDEHLSDESIDEIVRSTLVAEPSSNFVSRVRARMPATSSSLISSRAWVSLAGITIIVILIAGRLIAPSDSAPQSLPIIEGSTQIVDSVIEPVLTPQEFVLSKSTAHPAGRRERVLHERNAFTFPEVLVPPDQMLAIRALLRNVNKYEFSFPEESAQAFTQMTIQPLVVEPLGVTSVSGGLQ